MANNPKNPFKKIAAREAPTAAELISLGQPESSSGKPEKVPRVPAKFAAKAKASFVDEPHVADGLTQRFIYSHIKRGSSSRKVFEHVIESTSRAPSKRNLERMRAVANEVGRRRGGGKEMRTLLTQQLVDELIEKSAEQ